MSDNYENCRLCLNYCDKLVIKGIEKQDITALNTLLIPVDLTLTENPGICVDCAQTLDKNFNFKMKSICSVDYLYNFMQDDGNINFAGFYGSLGMPQPGPDELTCKLCLQATTVEMVLDSKYTERFENLLSEMNVMLSDMDGVCPDCYYNLLDMFDFSAFVMEWEEKLRNYVDVIYPRGIQENKVNLADFLKFIDNWATDVLAPGGSTEPSTSASTTRQQWNQPSGSRLTLQWSDQSLSSASQPNIDQGLEEKESLEAMVDDDSDEKSQIEMLFEEEILTASELLEDLELSDEED